MFKEDADRRSLVVRYGYVEHPVAVEILERDPAGLGDALERDLRREGAPPLVAKDAQLVAGRERRVGHDEIAKAVAVDISYGERRDGALDRVDDRRREDGDAAGGRVGGVGRRARRRVGSRVERRVGGGRVGTPLGIRGFTRVEGRGARVARLHRTAVRVAPIVSVSVTARRRVRRRGAHPALGRSAGCIPGCRGRVRARAPRASVERASATGDANKNDERRGDAAPRARTRGSHRRCTLRPNQARASAATSKSEEGQTRVRIQEEPDPPPIRWTG